MFPLQTISDPAMAVVVLSVVMTLVVIFGFIWAYSKISEPPEDHETDGHGA
jgi:nitrogen fixation-related uncharacterized protein